MRFLWIAAVLFAGCLPEEDDQSSAEGDHLIVHVQSDAQFDHVDVVLVDLGNAQEDLQLTLAQTTYDYDHWEVFDAVHDVKITVQLQGTVVGSGEATNIEYVPAGDGSNIAHITMHLTP